MDPSFFWENRHKTIPNAVKSIVREGFGKRKTGKI